MAKDFKNAAMSFITSATSELSEPDLSPSPSKDKNADRKKSHDQEPESAVKRMMGDKKKKRERKSRRVNLLMYPSLVDSLKAKAEEEDTSMNDILCRAAEEFLQNHYKN